MKSPARLAALAALVLLPLPAAAQDAGVREPDTSLRMETTRRRLVVRPAPPVARALEDAARAADDLAPRRGGEEGAVARRPPSLDPDVTSAIQARNLQRALRR
jgi:hypothetical protein